MPKPGELVTQITSAQGQPHEAGPTDSGSLLHKSHRGFDTTFFMTSDSLVGKILWQALHMNTLTLQGTPEFQIDFYKDCLSRPVELSAWYVCTF